MGARDCRSDCRELCELLGLPFGGRSFSRRERGVGLGSPWRPALGHRPWATLSPEGTGQAGRLRSGREVTKRGPGQCRTPIPARKVALCRASLRPAAGRGPSPAPKVQRLQGSPCAPQRTAIGPICAGDATYLSAEELPDQGGGHLLHEEAVHARLCPRGPPRSPRPGSVGQ